MAIKYINRSNSSAATSVGNSVQFNGSNNLQTPSDAAFAFGTGDWTIDCWIRTATSNAMKIWRFSDNSDNLDVDLGFSTFGGLGYYNGSNSTYSSAGIITSSVWYHIAAVRKSGTVTVYLNGAAVINQSSTPNSSTRYLNVGSAAGATFNGYISNFRVVKGTALYTSSFTPPTSPLTAIANTSLLTCNAPTIVDASTNNFTITNNNSATVSSTTPFTAATAVSTIKFKNRSNAPITAATGNSVLFNGTNQYLSIPNNTAFQLGTGDFTAECWTYATSMPQSFARLLSVAGTYSGANVGLEINISTSTAPVNSIEFCINGNNTTYFRISTNSAISINTWYHVAVTRLSGTIYCFLNGVLQTSSTSGASTNINGSGGATIAAAIGGGGYWPGYVSNVRILKGTALYTASFTAPTTPLTAISGTSLLTCNAPTIVDGSTNNFTITNNNSATVSATTPFTSTSNVSTFKFKKVYSDPITYMVATGGDLITTSGSYKIHTFTTVGTSSFVVSSVGVVTSVECLLVAGGGGGGYGSGGGGGAGGVIYSASYSISPGTYNIVVGDGGLGNNALSVPTVSNNGKNSTFATLTALGGGGGGGNGGVTPTANNGGSGGGLGNSSGTVGTGLQPSSISGGYGNNGALGAGSTPYNAGGGGGAGAAGSAGSSGGVGRGGIGITNAFINSVGVGELYSGNYYVGGGGTGGPDSFRGASGGLGGIGGGGGSTAANNGTTGSMNTGGGGGAGANTGNQNGGNGGSGVVVIKYRYTA